MQFRSLSIAAACALMLLVACKPQPENPLVASSVGVNRAPMTAAVAAAQAPQLMPGDGKTSGNEEEIAAALGGKDSKVVKVGLLLPLTGRNAELGKALQNAATVSLFDKYARLPLNEQRIKVQLISKDTGDSPEFARAAMASALKEGAEFIIGPVFADATEAAAPLAAAQNISVLSFSNNRQKAGSGAYLIGFSPQQQALRVVDYAYKKEKKRIAVLVPKSPLGDEVLAAAEASAKNAGIALAGTAQYAPGGIGLDTALAKLMPNNGEGPDFDALLLADGGPTLETILRALSTRGITNSNVQLLGTGVWDDIALLQRVNLDGAWFSSSSPAATAQFESRFRATYGYAPPRIASLAYDAVALAVTLAASGRPFSQANLTNKAGFYGPANGIFRLRPDAPADRGLAVIQVNGSTLQVISPGATGFTAR